MNIAKRRGKNKKQTEKKTILFLGWPAETGHFPINEKAGKAEIASILGNDHGLDPETGGDFGDRRSMVPDPQREVVRRTFETPAVKEGLHIRQEFHRG